MQAQGCRFTFVSSGTDGLDLVETEVAACPAASCFAVASDPDESPSLVPPCALIASANQCAGGRDLLSDKEESKCCQSERVGGGCRIRSLLGHKARDLKLCGESATVKSFIALFDHGPR